MSGSEPGAIPEWEGVVVKKYRALLDGANLYRRVLVRLDDGRTVKMRVDRAMWAALTVGDTVRTTAGGLRKRVPDTGPRRQRFASPSIRTTLMPGPASNSLAPILLLIFVVGSDLWVYLDARAHVKRGTPVLFSMGAFEISTPEAWLLGSLLLWIAFLPLYLASRSRAG